MKCCMDVLLLLPGVMGLVTDYMHGVRLCSMKKVGDSTETKSVWDKGTGKVQTVILVWNGLLYGHAECEPIYICKMIGLFFMGVCDYNLPMCICMYKASVR